MFADPRASDALVRGFISHWLNLRRLEEYTPDLQLLALQKDLTRVITFMLGSELSGRPYPQIGVPDAHHPLSHHNDRPDLVERLSKINVAKSPLSGTIRQCK